ncbi:MAG: REP-associated tyrosine transposase [Thermoguttaceae bacterium]
MSWYRRNYVAGGTFFFTIVTYRRHEMLTSPLARKSLRTAIEKIQKRWSFEIPAMALLPDHLHCIWTLPSGDDKYSRRWRRIKEEFTRTYLAGGGREIPQSRSRARHQERGVWQRRYWEHTCDDEADLKRCVDYIHWNPKKHGLVGTVKDWPWSSFHRYVQMGEYSLEWGDEDPTPGYDDPEWE